MADPLEQELILDISGALSSIQSLDEALSQVAANFEANLTAAIESLSATAVSVEPDTTALEAGIQDALAQAQEPIPIEGDTSGLESDIQAATDTTATIPVDADIADAQAAIDTLGIDGLNVPVDADVSAAQDAIAALSGETITADLEVDTAGAQDAIDTIGGSAAGATANIGGLDSATAGFAATAAVARGEAAGLTGAADALGGGVGKVGVGLAALGATTGFFFHNALDAQAAVLRLNQSMGPLASQIEHLKIGDLNADLSALALSLGSDDDNLRNIAATFFNFQKGAGTADATAAKFSETVLALSARAVALNPALGRVEDVAGRLGTVLGRGGRFASQFGLDLSSTEIKARAAENATHGLGDGVSFASLQLAGGQIALQKYGDHLQEDIARGTENPIIQLAALRQKFQEAAEAIGAPLVAPILGVLTDIEPVAEGVARVIGGLGQVAVPAVDAVVTALVPVEPLLEAAATGLGSIGDSLQAIPAPMRAVALGLGALAFAGRAAATAFVQSSIVFASTPLGAAVIGVSAAVTALGLFSDKAHKATGDTSSLATAFGIASSSTDQFAGTLSGLDKAIDDYLDKQLQLGKSPDRAIDATNRLGLSNKDLAAGLQLSGDAFDKWEGDLDAAARAAGASDKAANALWDALEQGRTTLEASASASLAAAVQNKFLTQSEVDAAEAHHHRVFETDRGRTVEIDAIGILKEKAAKIDAATAAQLRETRAAADSSGAFQDLATKIAAGTVTAASAADVSKQLGLTEADTTKVINDQIAAITAQTDARILASGAAQQLREDLASGTITAAQAQIGFLQLGVSLSGAATHIDAVDQAVAKFVSGAIGTLPTVGDAIDTFAHTVSADWKQVQDDIKNGSGSVQDDLKKLADDSDPQRFTDNLEAQASSIVTFTAHLRTLINEGFGAIAGEIALKGPELGGGLAAALASDPAKAKAAEGAAELRDSAVGSLSELLHQRFPQFQQLGVDAAGQLTVGMSGGIAAGGPSIGQAVDSVTAHATARFHPDLRHGMSEAVAGATAALADDPRISNAAAAKGFEALAAFQKAGPVSYGEAAKIALAGARAAIENDRTLAAKSGAKADETTKAFKPRIDQSTKQAFDSAALIIPQLTNIATAAGTAGHAVGVAFDTGMVQGIDQNRAAVHDAAVRVAAEAKAGADAALGIKSPSTVGITIGNQFVQGIVIGLSDTSGVSSSSAAIGEQVVQGMTSSLSGVGTTLAAQVVDGFNDPATINAGIKRLQDLIAQATTRSAASTASSSFSQFVSSVISQVPAGAAAISTFGSSVSQAASAQAAAFAEAHKASVNYAADQRERAKLLAELAPATDALRDAQVRLFTDTAAKASPFALGIDKAQVKEAQQAVDDLNSKLGRAVTSLQQDRQELAHTSGVLSAASQALAAASSPDAFIRNLQKQTATNREFQHNLRLLSADGANELARQLAQAGPDAAGKLAAALASSPAKARQAQAALTAADAFTKSYQSYIEHQFAPKVTASVSGVAATVAAPIGTNISTSATKGAQDALVAIRSNLSAVPSTIKVFADTSAISTTVGATIPKTVPLSIVPTLEPLGSVTFPASSMEVVPHVVLPLPALEPIHVDVIPNLLPLPATQTATLATAAAPQVATLAAPAPGTLTQTIELDLNITLPSGQQVVASKTLQIEAGRAKQTIAAAVAAKVKA